MKHTLIAIALSALFAAPVLAQTPAEKPAAAPAAEAMKDPEAKPAKDVKLVQGPGQSKVTEDARHCLELSTNTDVIKCAEPYLPGKK